VYKIFFDEFMGSQHAADQRRDRGQDDADLRTLFQHVLGLTAFEHQVLASSAQACMSALDANLRATQQLVQELKQTQDKAPLQTKLAQLIAARDATVADGVHQLRLSLSPERFARLDLMIRVRVVPNLRIVRGTARQKAPSGGN
jgi:hypothetical protein